MHVHGFGAELRCTSEARCKAYRYNCWLVWDCENVGYIRIIMCICEQIFYFKFQGGKRKLLLQKWPKIFIFYQRLVTFCKNCLKFFTKITHEVSLLFLLHL